MTSAGDRNGSRLKVLLVEPYFAGSHRQWAIGYSAASAHDVRLVTLPGRFWKWRMHGGALTCARLVNQSDDSWRPDVILASDMLDLTTFLAATRSTLGNVPAAIYVHENQLAYPARPLKPEWSESRSRRAERDGEDAHYAFINVASFAVADQVFWNSEHNRSSFLQLLPGYLRSFPDHRELEVVDEIGARSSILPLRLDLAALDGARPLGQRSEGRRPLLITWNHRWEYDKGPETFFDALCTVLDQGGDFRLALMGERFESAPSEFDVALRRLGERCVHVGFVESRDEYAAVLWRSDLVVSTARHEFFGASTCEALYCGCDALLPSRLAYPELIPKEAHHDVLYADDVELAVRLLERCRASMTDGYRPAPECLRQSAARFDWSVQAPFYDRALYSVANAVRPARPLLGGSGSAK